MGIYAVFIVSALAQLLMLPLGWIAIKATKNLLRVQAVTLLTWIWPLLRRAVTAARGRSA